MNAAPDDKGPALDSTSRKYLEKLVVQMRRSDLPGYEKLIGMIERVLSRRRPVHQTEADGDGADPPDADD